MPLALPLALLALPLPTVPLPLPLPPLALPSALALTLPLTTLLWRLLPTPLLLLSLLWRPRLTLDSILPPPTQPLALALVLPQPSPPERPFALTVSRQFALLGIPPVILAPPLAV